MPIVLKSGSLKLLEPSGPVQACNGNGFYIYFVKVLFVWAETCCTFKIQHSSVCTITFVTPKYQNRMSDVTRHPFTTPANYASVCNLNFCGNDTEWYYGASQFKSRLVRRLPSSKYPRNFPQSLQACAWTVQSS